MSREHRQTASDPVVTSNVTVHPSFVTINIYFDDIEGMDHSLYAKYLRQAKVIVDDLVKSAYRLLDDAGFLGLWQKTQVNEAARIVTAGYVFESRLSGNQIGRVGLLMDRVRNMLTQKTARMRSDLEHSVMASEIIRVAKVLTASSLDGMNLQKARRVVNNILHRHSSGIFSDPGWAAVWRALNALKSEGIDYEITKTEYVRTRDDTNAIPKTKEWSFQIEFMNDRGRTSKLLGKVTTFAAGSVADPWDRYDMTAMVF